MDRSVRSNKENEKPNILELIPKGRENALHQEQLAEILGVSRDTVKSLVRKARKNGAEILSGISGYYYPKDDEERKAFVYTLSKQAFTRLKTARPIKSTLDEIKGQISLSDILKEYLREDGNGAGEP
jgi:biotin operon repressor